MAKSRDAFGWPDLWSLFNGLAKDHPEAATKLAIALNTDGPFEEWIGTRADDVQVEVMTGAPTFVLVAILPVMSTPAARKVYAKMAEKDRQAIRGACPELFN